MLNLVSKVSRKELVVKVHANVQIQIEKFHFYKFSKVINFCFSAVPARESRDCFTMYLLSRNDQEKGGNLATSTLVYC